MKSIATSLRDSFFSMLGRAAQPVPPEDLSAIQQAMLSLLPDIHTNALSKQLRTRILLTRDVESLWYLRAELFNQLCQRQDEALAARSLQGLEPLFERHLPDGLLRRRAPGARAPTLRGRSSRTSWDETHPPPGF